MTTTTSTSWTRSTAAFAWCCASALAACGGAGNAPTGADAGDEPAADAAPDGPAAEPFFPADFAAGYTEVRDCRRSIDHDLRYIVVYADGAALAPYRDRAAPFPVGATLVKVEHSDDVCETVTGYTASRRVDATPGSDATRWRWQRVDRDRRVVAGTDLGRCMSCHADCGVPPDGYQGTCAVP